MPITDMCIVYLNYNIPGLLMRPEKDEAKAEAEARKCEAEAEAEASV